MTTTILSSKQRFTSLLGRMLRRNLSTSIYLFVIMFVFFPLQMFFETRRELDYIARNNGGSWTNVVGDSLMYTSVSSVCMVIILLAAAIIVGLIQCSYLHNKRAVDLYHSLPVTRTQIMLAGAVSSFATIAVPYVINYIINIGVSVYRVSSITAAMSSAEYMASPLVINFGEVAWDMLGWLVSVFAIIAIVNLVATQVGSVFENFVFVCELLAAPALVILLNRTLSELFLTGYVYSMNLKLMFSLTPATFMLGRMADYGNHTFYNVITILWLVLGAAIMWAAVWLYHRRRSEIAESSGCKGFLGILFSTAAVYLAAPLVGVLIFSSLGDDNKRVYVVGVALGAVLSFLLIEAILNRGFAGIRSHLPRGGAVCAFVIAVAIVFTTGGLGYETRLPNPNKVDSVFINSRGWYDYAQEVVLNSPKKPNQHSTYEYYEFVDGVTLTDKEAITQAIAMHKQLITTNRAPITDTEYWSMYSIYYNMGGSEMKRRYERTNAEVDALLAQLEDTEAFQRAANPVLRVNPDIVKEVVLYDNLGFEAGELTAKSDITAILEAMGKDSLEQGTAPYVGGEPVLCYIYFETPLVNRMYSAIQSSGSTGYKPQSQHFNSFSMPVFASYKHTLAQLGSNLPAKASASDITEIGLGSYYYDHNGNDGERFISHVTNKGDYVKSDIDSYTKQQGQIEFAVENMINTAYVNDMSYSAPVYCTFFKGDVTGITVMLDLDSLPADYLASFADLNQRYQSIKDAKQAEVRAAETVNFTF